jgi:hypothetical protein
MTDTPISEPAEYDEEFVDCTCDHDDTDHDEGGCTICDCPGHWEEYEVNGS